jgi:hypothetical protein
MTAQTLVRPDTEISRKRGDAPKPRRVLWPIVLLIAMAVAGIVGVAVAAYVTDPPAPTRVVTQEPNANDREGRLPTTATQQPNANDREGRVPTTTTHEPNANDREGRVPTTVAQQPNANTREGRVPGHS